jgi:hypothetical protein
VRQRQTSASCDQFAIALFNDGLLLSDASRTSKINKTAGTKKLQMTSGAILRALGK